MRSHVCKHKELTFHNRISDGNKSSRSTKSSDPFILNIRNSSKYQKIEGFLMFSGVIEWERRSEIG